MGKDENIWKIPSFFHTEDDKACFGENMEGLGNHQVKGLWM